jgi:D-alanyl-D-alanine carboxypeptidase-like protein
VPLDLAALMSSLDATAKVAGTSPALEAMKKARLQRAEASRARMSQIMDMVSSLGLQQGGGGGAPSRGGGGGNLSTPTGGGGHGGGLVTIKTPNGGSVTVAKAYASKFAGLMQDLYNAGYHFKSVGGYSYRNIAGTNKLSKHATGEAIDIDPGPNRGTRLGGGGNPYGYFNPQTAVAIARKWGLDWGGTWKGQEDPMHFSTGG